MKHVYDPNTKMYRTELAAEYGYGFVVAMIALAGVIWGGDE